MKVGIVSDLHTEFWRPIHEQITDKIQSELADADVILLAGDIALGANAVTMAERLFRDKPVFLVAGNHEFYEGDYAKVLDDLRNAAAKSSNVRFLHQEAALLEWEGKRWRILGTTLWTDFDLHGQPDLGMLDAQVLNDFRLISFEGRLLKQSDTLMLHQQQRQWLLNALDESHDSQTILVTHHAPVSFAIAPRFIGDDLSPCFASRIEPLLIRDDLALVVWGHTHYCVSRQIAQTRFVSTQTGYAISAFNQIPRSETGQYGSVITL
jgi:predicted phosphodiesterase